MTLTALLSHLALGIAVFGSTNLDDIVLLSVFFADEHLRPRAIVVGQFAGMAALVLASSAAALASLAVPEGWTALLGVVPLALGIAKLSTLRRGKGDDRQGLRDREIALERRTHSQALSVAAVTFANGADNLGVYVPLFAKQPSAIPAYAVLFAAMTGAWCALGYWLVNNPFAGEHVRRYARLALPPVLIGLGVYILTGARMLLGR